MNILDIFSDDVPQDENFKRIKHKIALLSLINEALCNWHDFEKELPVFAANEKELSRWSGMARNRRFLLSRARAEALYQVSCDILDLYDELEEA